jgi:polyhydroxyalkanoate synthesis repressor PhaR
MSVHHGPLSNHFQNESFAMPDEPIRIKRYPNRRFYASHTSKYISLPEIEQLIHNGAEVEIVESYTGEDITRTVLMQIIAERHPDKIAVFPPAMLHSILRANSDMTDFWQEYFRRSLASLDYVQTHAASASKQPTNWLKAWLDTWSTPNANRAPNRSDADVHGDKRGITERISQLEERIGELESRRKKRP